MTKTEIYSVRDHADEHLAIIGAPATPTTPNPRETIYEISRSYALTGRTGTFWMARLEGETMDAFQRRADQRVQDVMDAEDGERI